MTGLNLGLSSDRAQTRNVWRQSSKLQKAEIFKYGPRDRTFSPFLNHSGNSHMIETSPLMQKSR
jgi:hypothetical protein